jgi:predicted nuclease with TOPRIM domain
LNNHTKKTKLTIEERHLKPKEEGMSYGEVSNFNEGRTLDKNKKIVKKDNILLKNLYNTEIIKKNDENKNILNEYRDEIELLKMDNERLREENERLKSNQEYLQRRLKEEKFEKSREFDELKMMHVEM